MPVANFATQNYSIMVKKLKTILSLFGGSGYRYNFTLFTFDRVHGVEGALPQQPAVIVFARRGYDRCRDRFTFEPICCSATPNLAGVAVSELAKSVPALVDANCVGVAFVPSEADRCSMVDDIAGRIFA